MTETTLALSVEHIAAALESVDLDDRNRITLHDPLLAVDDVRGFGQNGIVTTVS